MKTTTGSSERAPAPNRGLVDWLLSCPVKGYFVPIESESSDTLTAAVIHDAADEAERLDLEIAET